MYARQKVVTIAKAFRLQAIDMVHIDYKGEILLLTDRLIQVLRDRKMLQSWCTLDRRYMVNPFKNLLQNQKADDLGM